MQPNANVDFSNIGEEAQKARSDKKNTDDGKVKMAVAKEKNVWTMLALPFEDYRTALIRISKEI